MKKLQVVLTTLMLLLGLTFFNINNVFAWYNTPVQNKILYCPYGGEPAAKMGTTTQYGFIGPDPERDPQFYSALIAKGGDDQCDPYGWFYYVHTLRIEVSGVYPNGDTIPGDNFGGLTVLVSPDDSDVEQEILNTIYDILVDILPYGLGTVVKNTKSQGGAITHSDPEKAWAEWTFEGPTLDSIEKGLRFGYELNVDPALEGTYTINIHYSAVIWQALLPLYAGYVGTLDLYDTVYYDYVNTPNTPSTPSGPNSGYRGVSYSYTTYTTDPNLDFLRYEFSWGDGTTTLTGWYSSGTTVSASHIWNSLGTYNVKVRAQDSTGAWSGWSPYLTVNIVDRAPNTPSTPSGPALGYRNVWYTYSTTATDPDGDNIRYEFEFSGPIPTVSFTTGWYASGQTGSVTVMWETTDPPGTYYVRARAQDVYDVWSGWSAPLQVSIRDPILTISVSGSGSTSPAPGTHTYNYGTSVSVTATPSSGYYFAYWLLDSTTYYYSNPITVTMTADHSLRAYFYYSSGGGGDGCPTLFVWNGDSYVDYGVIDIHNPSGEDVVREVSIAKQDLAVEDSKVKIRLQEGWLGLNFSESEIDQVKLYAVDNHGNSLSCPLKKATCNGDNVRPILKESDDVKLNIYLLETVDLEFLVPYGDVQGFTFVIEGCNTMKM